MGALPSTNLDGYSELKKRVEGAISFLQEARSVEFKSAAEWHDLKHGLTKHILAMANLRDGGIVIVGISETNNVWSITGVTADQLDKYDPDDMIDHINKYASPPIEFNVATHTTSENKDLLVIQVYEFEEKPIVCKRNCGNELREGALYIRPVGKPESREVHNSDEMHDLLEVAAEKRTRSLLRQIQRVGIDLLTASSKRLDQDKFIAELEGH